MKLFVVHQGDFLCICNYKIKFILRTVYLYFLVYIKMDYCLYQNSASNGLNQHHCSAAESGTFPFLPPKIFDQRNGSCPTSKKFFSTKNESKCTQTSQSVN